MHWKVWRRVFAERVGDASLPTRWCAIWILPVPDASDGRKSEVVVDGLPLFGGSQLAVGTPRWCVHCTVTGPFTEVLQMQMVWWQHEEGKRERTLKLWALNPGRVSWSWLWRWVADGRLAKARSRQEPSLLRRRAEQAWRMRWGAFCRVLLPRLWRVLFFSRGALKGQMATLLPVGRWKLTTAMLA